MLPAARFHEKVVFITGSSRGLGKVLAEDFACEGATVIVNSSHSSVDGRRLASKIQEQGGRAVYIKADIANESEVIAVSKWIRTHFERLDILIHNAAGGCESTVLACSYQDFERTFLINTYALVTLSRAFESIMPQNSKMLFVSSMGALRALPGYAIVGASKAASEALVRSLALELAPKIQVNAIRPSVMETVSMRAFTHAPQFLKLAADEAPLGPGSISQVTGAALFLCSNEADYITGQFLDIDGGWSTSLKRPSLKPSDTSDI